LATLMSSTAPAVGAVHSGVHVLGEPEQSAMPLTSNARSSNGRPASR
jgi:hypothetical protein